MVDTHRPYHLFLDKVVYFVTGSTVGKESLFNSDSKKILLRDIFFEKAKKFNVTIIAWVILDNHYHLECEVEKGLNLAKFIKESHGKSSNCLNVYDKALGRKVWYQYWDSIVRGEKDFWRRFNYIHQNPLKHRFCANISEYRFSSYLDFINKNGLQWMNDCFDRYPIVDFVIAD